MQLDALAIGGANVDIICRPDVYLTAGESAPGSCEIKAGGVAVNVARHLSKLGRKVFLLTAVGSGALTEILLQSLIKLDIDCSHIIQSDQYRAATYSVIQNEQGATQFGVSDMQVLELIDPQYIAKHQSLLQQATITFVDTNLTIEALKRVTLHSSMGPLFVDTVSPQKAPRVLTILSKVNTIKSNLAEAQILTKKRPAADCAAELHRLGVEKAFVSANTEGLYWHSRNEQGHLAASSTAPDNDTGCGDIIMAALIDAELQKKSCQEAARYALSILDSVAIRG